MIAKSALRSGYAKRMLNGVFGRFLEKWWRARELRRGELRQWFRKAAAWELNDVVREHKQKQMERRGIENIKESVSDVNHEQRGVREEAQLLCDLRGMEVVVGKEDSRVVSERPEKVPEECFVRVRHRGDGNCLFYSLIGEDSEEKAMWWRQRIADWVEYNSGESVIEGVSIGELLVQEGGLGVVC